MGNFRTTSMHHAWQLIGPYWSRRMEVCRSEIKGTEGEFGIVCNYLEKLLVILERSVKVFGKKKR